MEDYPRNQAEFEARFASEEACRAYLTGLRWPDGFRCPKCQHPKGWPVRNLLVQCSACGRQTSVTAGTIFQDTRTPLTTWFRAMWCVASQKTGTSARTLHRVLGFGSYQTAWAWLHKLRRAMVRPGRERLAGRVEVDETYVGVEMSHAPLGWSRAATAGAGFFVLATASLAAPLLDFENPLGIAMFAMLGITTATGGVALYLSPFLAFGKTHRSQSIEALKAEQQVWTTIFSGTILWVGVFVGGAVLTTSLGGAGAVLKSMYPSVQELTIQSVVLYHAWVAGWVAVGAVLWMLRPLHRRLHAIARDIDTIYRAQSDMRP